MSEGEKPVAPMISDTDAEEPDVSRRGFFKTALRGVALAGAGAFVSMSGPVQAQYTGYGGYGGYGGYWGWGGNVWKSTALYRDAPNGPQFCARCVHFRWSNACEIVEPPIRPQGWCRFFYPRGAVYRRGPAMGPGY